VAGTLTAATNSVSISVVIPVHNGGGRVVDCLASLARQREHVLEFLVVDDSSTDGALECATSLGARVFKVASRSGPASARNLGALAATGDVLLFLDADVCIHDDTILRIRQRFEAEPELGAVFGSYDSDPRAPHLVSQFRNLLHCFVHQTSNQRASTFWSGCGAIRREIFLDSKGFDTSYSAPCVEDIELGVRLIRKGVRIALDPAIQVKHLKRWTFWGMVVTDIRYRGIPWTLLILASGQLPNDLNLRSSSRVSVALAAMVGTLFLTAVSGVLSVGACRKAWVLALAALVSLLFTNLPFYRFLAARRGLQFALSSVPLHLLYFSCCGVAFALGVAIHCWPQISLKLGLFTSARTRRLAITALIHVPPWVIAAFWASAAGR
jgi:GT2 family glycosyltransferase